MPVVRRPRAGRLWGKAKLRVHAVNQAVVSFRIRMRGERRYCGVPRQCRLPPDSVVTRMLEATVARKGSYGSPPCFTVEHLRRPLVGIQRLFVVGYML